MPKNMDSVTVIITLEGLEKQRLQKNTTRQYESNQVSIDILSGFFCFPKLVRNCYIVPLEFF